MIYLKHPIHGRKIASLEAEAIHDESHGWQRYKPAKDVSSFENSDNYGNAMEGKRRGRPPRVATQEV